MCRRHLTKIPWPNRMFERLGQRILANTLGAAEHQGVVDLLLRALNPVRQPFDAVVRLRRVKPVRMLDPTGGLCSVAKLDARRTVEVEASGVCALDPAAIHHQSTR